jgi:hypothetical protein
MDQNVLPAQTDGENPEVQNAQEPIGPELMALFRLLLKVAPQEHDFAQCPICKKHGITRI